MRKYLCFFLFVTTITTSCHKSHSDANIFQLTLNGTTYTFDSLWATIDTSTGAWSTSVNAINTKTRSVARFHTSSDSKNLNGTYSRIFPTPAHLFLLDFGAIILTSPSIGYGYQLGGQSFTLTINSSNDYKLSGSFSGTIGNTASYSNVSAKGSFSVPYIFN